MVEKNLTVLNASGIHVRPAGLIAALASKYEAELFMHFNGNEVDCSSMLSIMMLSVSCGSSVTFVAKGIGEEDIISELEELFFNKFDEE